jgi:hypothetical protein
VVGLRQDCDDVAFRSNDLKRIPLGWLQTPRASASGASSTAALSGERRLKLFVGGYLVPLFYSERLLKAGLRSR